MSTQALIAGIVVALIASAILGATMADPAVGIIMGIAIGTIAAIALNGAFDRGAKDR
jgi:hypothetical protein